MQSAYDPAMTRFDGYELLGSGTFLLGQAERYSNFTRHLFVISEDKILCFCCTVLFIRFSAPGQLSKLEVLTGALNRGEALI